MALFFERTDAPIEVFEVPCFFARCDGVEAKFYANKSDYTNRAAVVNSMGFADEARMLHFFTKHSATEVDDPGQIDPPAPDPKEEAAALLRQTEMDGSMIRIIEDLAEQVEALGGTIPASAAEKIARRKAARAVLLS